MYLFFPMTDMARTSAKTFQELQEEGEREGFIEVSDINALQWDRVLHYTKEDILKREESICLHSTTLQREERHLIEFDYDIDGVSIQCGRFDDILMQFTYFKIDTSYVIDLKKRHKKHFLQPTGPCYGIRLVETHGYELFLCVESLDQSTTDRKEITEMLNKIPQLFIDQAAHHKNAQTFRRNLVTTKSLKRGIKVMDEERPLILGIVDQIVHGETFMNVNIFPLITKYGQKQKEPVQLDEIILLAADGVKVMIHPAVTLTAREFEDMAKCSLLWSRSGLRQVVGGRGTMYSALSLTAAGNFQTNLDGRSLTIKNELKDIFLLPATFIQFYADTTHIKVQDLIEHPISGLISCCGLLHKEVSYIG